jgi:hypothetical protein
MAWKSVSEFVLQKGPMKKIIYTIPSYALGSRDDAKTSGKCQSLAGLVGLWNSRARSTR